MAEPIITLSQACREAITNLGFDVAISDVRKWIKKFYPTFTYRDATLRSLLSITKREMRRKQQEAKAATNTNDPAPLDQTLEILRTPSRLAKMAKEIGGFAALRSCLDYAEKIANQTKESEKK